MAHNRVFGICEQKCRVEVPTKEEFNEAISQRYTQKEVNNLLESKSDVSHSHDGRYYTETEINNKLSTKLDTNRIAVLTGTATLDSTGAGKFTVNYPSGFNQSNCVILSTGIVYNNMYQYNLAGPYVRATTMPGNVQVNMVSGPVNVSRTARVVLYKFA